MLQERMTQSPTAVSLLSDAELLAEVKGAAAREREATVRLIALLAQMDVRRLYLGEGCSSLFTYCTQVLHLSEHAAYGRIEAARAARRFPVIHDLLSDGSMTLTTVTLLAPHLTPANHVEVLDAARHKTKRDVEHIVARLRPQPAVPATVRRLPEPRRAPAPGRPSVVEPTAHADSALILAPPPTRRPATVTPLAPERYKVQFTMSPETHDKLRRAQDLLRHSLPNGDPAAIFDRALSLLLADLERAKLAATTRPRAARPPASGSRHIPAAVRRAVWQRDGGQCAFVGTEARCRERGFLEFHHVRPYADGGATVVENLELRCRAHNLHEAEKSFVGTPPLLVREARPPSYCAATRSGTTVTSGRLLMSPRVVCCEDMYFVLNASGLRRVADRRSEGLSHMHATERPGVGHESGRLGKSTTVPPTKACMEASGPSSISWSQIRTGASSRPAGSTIQDIQVVPSPSSRVTQRPPVKRRITSPTSATSGANVSGGLDHGRHEQDCQCHISPPDATCR